MVTPDGRTLTDQGPYTVPNPNVDLTGRRNTPLNELPVGTYTMKIQRVDTIGQGITAILTLAEGSFTLQP